MIDMHTHLLPTVDDGAESIEQTTKLIQEAKNVGFKAIVLTSHYLEGYYEKNVNERKQILEKIQEPIELYMGNEVYLSENIIKNIKEGKIATINGTRYILFELPFHTEPMNLYEIVYEMLENKLIPILAHPERYTFVWKKPELINDLIQKGVLMQANYGSVIGMYGKKAQIIVKKFLQNSMIHILGTDVHKPNTIYTKMPEILEEIKELIGEEKLEELSNTNPKLILKGERINFQEVTEWKYTLKEKWIMCK